MRERTPTMDEAEFFGHLVDLVPGVRADHHSGDDGTPTMTASYDDVVNGFVVATCRVDFDGTTLTAARGRAYLDLDDTGQALELPDDPRHAAPRGRRLARRGHPGPSNALGIGDPVDPRVRRANPRQNGLQSPVRVENYTIDVLPTAWRA